MDLERRRVVDVLPVRTADAVAAWLAAHPDIAIISRDRHGPYAKAVRRGAPQAAQVEHEMEAISDLVACGAPRRTALAYGPCRSRLMISMSEWAASHAATASAVRTGRTSTTCRRSKSTRIVP